jgi:hypothetical protein
VSISKELFLAILSLDSYNRGYNAGIADGGPEDLDGLGEAGKSIGNATVLNVPLPAGSFSEGFYAVAYDVPSGTNTPNSTVISYRGTDGYRESTVSGGNDIWNGWTFGAGKPTSQIQLAQDFYQSVTGKSAFEPNSAAWVGWVKPTPSDTRSAQPALPPDSPDVVNAPEPGSPYGPMLAQSWPKPIRLTSH